MIKRVTCKPIMIDCHYTESVREKILIQKCLGGANNVMLSISISPRDNVPVNKMYMYSLKLFILSYMAWTLQNHTLETFRKQVAHFITELQYLPLSFIFHFARKYKIVSSYDILLHLDYTCLSLPVVYFSLKTVTFAMFSSNHFSCHLFISMIDQHKPR